MTKSHEAAARSPASYDQPADENLVIWSQVRAMVELHLKQGLRKRTTALGKQVKPVQQIVVVMLAFGLLFTIAGRRAADLETFLILLFTSTFTLVSLNLLPDTLDARRRQVELLASKPINSKTMLMARTMNLLILAALISTFFSVIPLATLPVFYGEIWLVPPIYLTLVAGSFAVAVLWLTLLILVARWLNLERLRLFVQVLLTIVSLGLMVLSIVATAIPGTDGIPATISLAGNHAVDFLPSAWFARIFTGGRGSITMIERLGALLMVGASSYLTLRVDLSKRYPDLSDILLASDARPARATLAARAVRLLSNIPVLSTLLAPPPAAGVASLIIIATGREVVSRLKVLAPRVVLIGLFLWGLTSEDRFVSPSLITFYGFMSLIDGWEIVKQSQQAQACWVLLTSPLDARHLSGGIRLALMIKYFSLPLLLVTLTFFFRHPFELAAVLSLLFLAEARAVISLLLALRPALPLSQEQVPGSVLAGFAISIGVSTVTNVIYAVVVAFEELFPLSGVVIGVIVLLFMVFANLLLERQARTRLSRLEYAY
jgi:hypothetical protein